MLKKFIYIDSAPSYEFMREEDGCYFLFEERLLVPKGLMQQNMLEVSQYINTLVICISNYTI